MADMQRSNRLTQVLRQTCRRIEDKDVAYRGIEAARGSRDPHRGGQPHQGHRDRQRGFADEFCQFVMPLSFHCRPRGANLLPRIPRHVHRRGTACLCAHANSANINARPMGSTRPISATRACWPP